jgi:hypothetical protein
VGLLAQEIAEDDFLEVVTSTPHVVTHFFHEGFERCKVMDKHLTVLARKNFSTRFLKLSAPVRHPPIPTMALLFTYYTNH